MAIEAQNFGLVRTGTGKAELKCVPVPVLRPDYVLVRTIAVALNPTDWTTLDAKGLNGSLVGCDYMGIVEEVGQAVKRNFKKGDRIAGPGHGGNDANFETGTFARYIAVKGDLQMLVPDGISAEAAASVGSAVGTAGYGLYKVLGLPWPSLDPGEASVVEDKIVFIYGGSTATGTIAIQLAKLSGCKVITTCSPKNFDLVKDRGADLVLDYHTPNVGKQVHEATGGKLTEVFDTVAVESSAQICADAFGENGGIYCNLLGIDCPRADVKSIFFLSYSLSGESYIFEGDHYEAQPEDLEFGSRFYSVAERLWHQGKIRAHPQRVGPGGLVGVLDGLQEMRQGRYSGEKLVYRVDETSWPF